MAKLTIGQKAARVLEFLMGLRNKRVAGSLAAHGFTAADLAEGWKLMEALTHGRLDVTVTPANADPALLLALDAWENKWFPIISASLRSRFPAAHVSLFRNLTQTDGVEVVISVSTLLSRIDALGSKGEDKEVRALLEHRGLTKKVIADARQLLGLLGSFDKTVEPEGGVSEEEEAAREAALWNWYLEWSGIARAVISERRSLRSLGFLTERGSVVQDAGTPTTMAPEVVLGTVTDSRALERVDVYALGVLAYRLLVGRYPFRGKSAAEVLGMQVSEPPPSPRSLRPDLPASFERALLDGLEKSPARRTASVAHLRAALHAAHAA